MFQFICDVESVHQHLNLSYDTIPSDQTPIKVSTFGIRYFINVMKVDDIYKVYYELRLGKRQRALITESEYLKDSQFKQAIFYWRMSNLYVLCVHYHDKKSLFFGNEASRDFCCQVIWQNHKLVLCNSARSLDFIAYNLLFDETRAIRQYMSQHEQSRLIKRLVTSFYERCIERRLKPYAPGYERIFRWMKHAHTQCYEDNIDIYARQDTTIINNMVEFCNDKIPNYRFFAIFIIKLRYAFFMELDYVMAWFDQHTAYYEALADEAPPYYCLINKLRELNMSCEDALKAHLISPYTICLALCLRYRLMKYLFNLHVTLRLGQSFPMSCFNNYLESFDVVFGM